MHFFGQPARAVPPDLRCAEGEGSTASPSSEEEEEEARAAADRQQPYNIHLKKKKN